MAIVLPTLGQAGWGTTLNTALTSLDTRTTALEAKFVAAPATKTSTGVAGQIAYDATHIYVCVATNSWVRATLAIW